MPRKHIKDDDLDFKIFVDPSCLSEPSEEEEEEAIEPSTASTNTDTHTDTDTTMTIDEVSDATLPDTVESVKETSTITVEDIDVPQEIPVEDVIVDSKEEEDVAPAVAEEDVQQDVSVPESTEEAEQLDSSVAVSEEAESQPSAADDEQDSPVVDTGVEHKEEEQQLEAQQEETSTVEDVSDVEPQEVEEPETTPPVDEASDEIPTEAQDVPLNNEEDSPAPLDEDTAEAEQQPEEHEHHIQEDAEQAQPQSTDPTDDTEADAETNRSLPSQHFTERKTSLRTEALIQAAARAVVARIERRQASGDSIHPEEEEEELEDVEVSILSTATEEGDTMVQYDQDNHPEEHEQEENVNSRRQSTNSTGSQLHHDVPSGSDEEGGGGESSSHHEPESSSDDVFSDRSARSSIASFEAADAEDAAHHEHDNDNDNDEDLTLKSPMLHAHDQSDTRSMRSMDSRTRSPRMSGVSMISDLSQYDKEDFVPTSREARLPFRTPSAIRNIQMSSPTPSVIHGSSPRSAKRQNGNGGLPPTISRLGSPNVTTPHAQYSPKGRSTPTRLKSRREAPLVLLHVTVLPLRWMWGDILNCLDALNGKTFGENKELFEASEQLKSLRDSWRELQDHVSDTVLERGVLIPHPQNDYEVLEERLLESLDLPLRRRARILECGHYLGPANEFGDEEEFDESEDGDEYAGEQEEKEEKRHWCNTCRNEIKYEDLGPGKVFRVKVYASNGLMRAGAWEACWKEMERVDIEVEPIVEMSVQNELEKLIIINGELEEKRQREIEEAEAAAAASAAQVARDEQETQLQSLAQSRPQSVAAHNAMVIQESHFNEEQQALPSSDLSRSLMDTPTHDQQQQRSTAMVSSPSPSSMQMMTMHALPAQPPSTVASMRFASPSPQPHQQSPLRHAILPADLNDEERIRRDEEEARLRDMYVDTPQQQPLLPTIEPAIADPISPSSSMYPHHPTSSRHLEQESPYIPPPSPRSPSEEAYERQRRRNSNSRSRGRSSTSHSTRSGGVGGANGSRLSGKDLENASFSDLLLEAFKVLLRDPKNVAIIVLCVFVAVMLGRPGTPAQTGLEVVPRGVHQVGNDGYRYDNTHTPKPVAEVVVNPPVAPVVQVESAAAAAAAAAAAVVVPEVPPVPVVVQVVTTTVTTSPAEPSLDVQLSEETIVDHVVETGTEASVEASPAVVESEATVDVPAVSVVDEEQTVTEPEESKELVQEESQDIVAPSVEEDTAEAPEPVVVLTTEEEEQGDAPVVDGTEESSSSFPIEATDELASASQAVVPLDTESNIAESTQPVEEAPVEEEELASAAANEEETTETATASESSTAITTEAAAATTTTTTSAAQDPCTPSIVSQRTTLRIYETITETVTVSAVTAERKTETAPVTETAVPQTVEETVYETETVRVTVSVLQHDEL